jgi:hypothetical protein
MKPWIKVALVTALFAVPAMALGQVIWPPAPGGLSPPRHSSPSSSSLLPSRRLRSVSVSPSITRVSASSVGSTQFKVNRDDLEAIS